VKAAAQFVSFLFHPLLLTSYLVLLLGIFFPPMLMIKPQNVLLIAGFVSLVTFVLPAFNLLTFKYFGTISSLTLGSRKERVLQFFFIAVIYILVTFMFYYKLPISANFIRLMMIISALVLAAAVITIFYKLSIHSLAMWGGVGILLPLNKVSETGELLWPTVGIIIVTGLVMSSRLYLNAHTPREVLVGSVTGFVIGFGGMIVLF
jgi:hypothetical protein